MRFRSRRAKRAAEAEDCRTTGDRPKTRELSDAVTAVTGHDATGAYADRLPSGATIGSDERLAVISGRMHSAAKPDIRNA
ncbi:hypothetical protein [Actinomadura sp. BRA 177]|uniref:hypothetical protein n=1 Tax=Actinomadura sp. BRA 177 TaxID=2745202 RepID=UPI0015962C7F|nr:hypothetical protein [Actinomadura sp. BRA 177]NVI86425.1 hypothetical protein [Actinomadura sp. BRA 177]